MKNRSAFSRLRQRGVTMIELLIGLTIGSLIIIGVVFVYSQSRTTYALNETTARLQENGRYGLSVLEGDIMMAGYYGFTNVPSKYFFRNGGTNVSITETKQVLADADMSGIYSNCGKNFMLDLLRTVQGTNDTYSITCLPPSATAGSSVANTDTLTIRRASAMTSPANAGRVQLYTSALTGANQWVFNSGTIPPPGFVDADHEIRNLIVRSYYLATNSLSRTNYRTLWRKSLDTNSSGSAPAVVDEEILPGVEDFQVQFGIDTGDHDGVLGIDVDKNPVDSRPDRLNGVVSKWVDPGQVLMDPPPLGRGAQVAAVRVWLMIRAEQPELRYNDAKTYVYAGRTFDPAGADESIRRVLVSRTIYLRNARTL
jgi:type IV pilus assembly protein PilW